MLSPKRTRFRKQHRGRLKGVSTRGNRICFGTFALQALEPAWITARQIEAGRRAITRYARRGGKIWIRIFPDKPITMRPAETRMGSGKGSPEYWVSVVKPGRILYEIGGVSESIAKAAMRIAAYKMPIRTQIMTATESRDLVKMDREIFRIGNNRGICSTQGTR
uniref:Large ribosomal subunit protein uL16c n=21 Tax=Euphyllophyta TaxID=78536 RepID=A0A059SR42_OSMCI|nr:ribosomal protein L16 [Osmundastrum cinnamomeum]AHA59594.1 ribosomal protein L16 [Osmundastrum cinnamomeum]